MAIMTEMLNGDLVKTYSDAKVMIHGGSPEGDYEKAVDPVSAGRTYTETDIPIPDREKEATIEDYKQALRDLGVIVDEEAGA